MGHVFDSINAAGIPLASSAPLGASQRRDWHARGRHSPRSADLVLVCSFPTPRQSRPDAAQNTRARACHRRALRTAPGRLVLAHGASAAVWFPARRARVPRRVTASPSALLMWTLTKLAWPHHLEDDGCARGGAPALIPAVLVFAYLAVVLYIGIFAFRHRRQTDTRPRTSSWPAARSGRSSSCCRSSAPT